MKIVRLLALAGVFVAFTNTARAGNIDYSTSSFAISGIGAEYSSIYDSFVIAGTSGKVNPNATPHLDSVELGTYTFTVGPHCVTCAQTPSGFTTGFNLTVGGQTEGILLPWSWSSNKTTDSLVVGTAAPLTFSLGTESLTVTGLSLGTLHSTGGVVTGDVLASFNFSQIITQQAATTLPEPRSLAVFGMGLLGLAGLLAWRRRACKGAGAEA
ncbi:hypothetical protein GCM10011611_20000 [Aliidongia dinghuensis]|uniref:PEP-CTERM sorting domain-containing protein n=1 Tax=Aliidongia dinghuensis TaxID=1867774 RepID=A0A8J2YSN4_9PROT|nr:hypothetical protein [Aliidongia dinghuensis]GGF14241.1 hypothetical protein GCM10011611_20000 [Aliidongia dinghuensis]